ncbi:MAG: hypothetical protein EA350_09795 [Gemmatimonadales bacterium]|nr:MAG: hypothetical protein EA350_09795 [Gemmatimonadales bacterium]
MSPPRLSVHLLGPLEVQTGGERVDLPPSRKARALLAYLAATGRPHARSALCDLFWPEVNDPRAGLRWALSKLRDVVHHEGAEPLMCARDRVALDVDAVDVDLRRVTSLVPAEASQASTEALLEAVHAFRGGFVEGLDLPACHQFAAWSLGTRERLHGLHVSVHATLCRRLQGDPEAALPHALARLSLDPFTEAAYLEAMEVLAGVGRVDQGLEVYERCCRMLADHLGRGPSEALQTARWQLGSAAPPASPSAAPSASPSARAAEPDADAPEADAPSPAGSNLAAILADLPPPDHLPALDTGEPRLVGRSSELEALLGVIHGSGDGGRDNSFLLTGEAGIGKTRLLRELVARVREAGGWVLSGPIFETEEVRPFGPWADLLAGLPRGALGGDAEVAGLSAVLQGRASGARTDRPTARAQFFGAVARWLASLAEARTPALVVLDDIQWLDASSAALLHFLVRELAPTPVAFGLAAREGEISPTTPVARMLRSLLVSGRTARVSLARLDAPDTETLVRSVAREVDPARVFAASEGNPFFALALATSDAPGRGETPRSIEEELDDRLERLDPGARALLPWAAALGRAFDVPLLVRVVDRPDHEIVEAIDTLERRGILRASGEDRYDFTHSLLRQAATDRLSEPVRRQVHRSIARALDAMDRTEGRLPGAVAHHAERGGLSAVAAAACAEAADDHLWVFAYDEAATMVERGRAQLEGLPDETRIPLEVDLLRLYSFAGLADHRPDDVEDELRRVTDEAVSLGLGQSVAKGHASLMEIQYQRGAFDEAGRSSLRSAEAGRTGDPGSAARALAETAACLLLLDQALDDARRLVDESTQLARSHGLEIDVVALAGALLSHQDGELAAAHAAFREVIRRGRRQRDRWWELPALARMTMVELDQGAYAAALARARETGELAVRMGDPVQGAFARGLAALAAGRGGEAEGGMERVDAALEELRDLDSLWKIAHLQGYAAEDDIARGCPASARERADETLRAARTLERPSLHVLSRALLAHCAALEGDPRAARKHLDAPEVTHPHHRPSHRALEALERARAAAAAAAPS